MESPGGELSHAIPPPIKGTAVLYISANFNKRNIVLDLKEEGDRAIALKLVEKSDVFVQNMRPGRGRAFGSGAMMWSLSSIHACCMCPASAYGRTGPMAKRGRDRSDRPGIWRLVQYYRQVRFAGRDVPPPGPSRYHDQYHDRRSRFCRPCWHGSARARDSMLRSIWSQPRLSLQTSRLAEYFATGEQPQPHGLAPWQRPCRTRPLCVRIRNIWRSGVVSEDQWPALLSRHRTGSPVRRFRALRPIRSGVENRAALVALLEDHFKTKPTRWWSLRLTQAGVPNTRVDRTVNFSGTPRRPPSHTQSTHC